MHSIKNWRPWVIVIPKVWEVMEGYGKREDRTHNHHQDCCLFNVLPASLVMETDVDLLMVIKSVKLLLLIFYTTTAKTSPPIPPRSKHFTFITLSLCHTCIYIKVCCMHARSFRRTHKKKYERLIVYAPTDATHCSVASLFTSLCDLPIVFPCEDVYC